MGGTKDRRSKHFLVFKIEFLLGENQMTHGASFLTLCICVLCIIAGAANKENYETKITKKEEKGIILEGIRKNNDFCFTNRRNNKCSKNYENSGRRNEETEASEQDFVKMKRKNKGNIVKEWQVIFFEPKCYTNELKDEISGNKLYESEILGYLLFSNSTVILQSLAFAECSNGRVFCAECESTMVLSACRICTKITASPIELSCSDAMLTNVTLHSMNPSSFQQAPLILGKSCISISPKLGNVLVSSSFFSSFTVSSAPFLSSKFIEKATLSNLEFFNISSTFKSKQSISKDVKECSTIISCCLFSSVCDALDGGIVRSINAPSSSLLATNTSFVGCYRTTNAEFIGNESNPSKPGRQNSTSEVINTFIWCEWNGSKANGTGEFKEDGTSSGGAIWMSNLPSGSLSAFHCSFNDCSAHGCGGGIVCFDINSVKVANCSFIACVAKENYGGGMYLINIYYCILVADCAFRECSSNHLGGGLNLGAFNMSGGKCIEDESGETDSAWLKNCSFIRCTIENIKGGGFCCYSIPAEFKMKEIVFISCFARAFGGGMRLEHYEETHPNDDKYCYFLFFHDCACSESIPYGHDVFIIDRCNLMQSTNPFFECYSTNMDDRRVCYGYSSDNEIFEQTKMKNWLKDGVIDRFVGIDGMDSGEWCGLSQFTRCKTIGFAVENSLNQLKSRIVILEGKHASEIHTIDVCEKSIDIVGKGKDQSSISTESLNSSASFLFSVLNGNLYGAHFCIFLSFSSHLSQSVFVVASESGALSLEEVKITSETEKEVSLSTSIFKLPLSQLSMCVVEIEMISGSLPLFSEPHSSTIESKESILSNVTIRNVNRTTGDGVVMAKSVKGGETFVVRNVTMDGCKCLDGCGGGIKVELEESSSKACIGTTSSQDGGTTTFDQCSCGGYGGGVMLFLADNSFDFEISSVSFIGCSATLGGKDVFVNGSKLVSGTITIAKLNVGHNGSVYDELMGYDRNEGGMGIFPLNVFFDAFSGAAHVGKGVNGYGGYDSWFCGFGYFPCSTIEFASQNRFSSSKKNIVLDSEFELGEVVSMAGSYEWEVYCGINKTDVNVRVPSGMTSSYLINVQSASSIKNIAFQIPFLLSSATSLIGLTSSSLTLIDCSVAHLSESTSSVAFGYSFVNAQSGSLNMERFVIGGALVFGAHSAIEFSEGMASVICSGCNISGVVKNCGDGGWIKGTVGGSGTLTVDGCNVNGCSCVGGKGGGIYVGLKENGKVVMNGTLIFEGCCAGSLEEKGRGGGLFINVDSTESDFTIYESVIFSEENPNKAFHGSDVFVQCGSGLLLEEIVNQASFGFFKDGNCMNNEEKLCGCEDGTSLPVIPLCVYLCDFESPISVDERSGADHSHCGYSVFCCSTIDFCVRERVNELVNAMEVISSASIKNPFVVPLFQTSQISISSSSASSSSSQYPLVNVGLTDNISTDCHNVIQCSGSFSLSFLSFALPRVLPSSISSIIQSSIFLSLSNISIVFSADTLASSVAFSLIHVSGGELELTGLVVSEDITFAALPPINVNGESRVAVEGCTLTEMANEGGSGGCVKVETSGGGTISIKNTNISSKCKNEEGLRGGGMMILIGSGGSLEMKNVNLSECEVPSVDIEDGGKGMGGGMFVALPEEIEKFVMEGMTFEGCNAWKGKNLFVSGWDLREVVNKDHLKWEMSSEELESLDELCGWEGMTTGEEYEIPLVVYLWSNWSGKGFVSKEKGGGFSGCGYSEAPCSSIDHMIKMRFSPVGLEKSIIKVEGSASLKHSVSLLPSKPSDENRPLISVEGGDEAVHLFVSGDGDSSDDGSLISNSVNASFSNLIIDLPSRCEFHKSFIRSVYSVSFSLCRFIPSDTLSPSSSSLCVLDIAEGDVSLEHCALATLSLANPFLRLSANFHSAHMHNTSFINSSVSSDSFISVFPTGLHSNQLALGDSPDLPVDCPSMNMTSVTVENVSRTEEGSVFLGVDEFAGLKCGMENCTFWNCLSRQSNRGGGLMMHMKNEESSLGVKNCTFVLCACSESTGRGGGMMLDFCDPDAPFQTPSKPLLLHIAGVQFMMNSAFMGKDVFINCHSIGEQINETLFALDFSQPSLRMNTSICGSDSAHSDIDLIPLITFLYTPQVFVSMESEDSNQCGKQDNPCRSVSHGVRHVQAGLFNAICVDSSSVVAEPTVVSDLTLKSITKHQSAIHFNSSIEEESEGSWIMLFENECLVEDCLFSFDEHFSAEHTAIMKQLNGSLAFSGCTLQSSSVESTLNSSVIVVEGGVFEMEKSSICVMGTAQPLFLFKGGSAATLNQIEISTIKTTATAMIVESSASVNIMQLAASDIRLCGENFISLAKGKNQHVNEKDAGERVVLQMGISSFSNITSSSSNSHVVESACEKTRSQLLNCSFERCFTPSEKGSLVEISSGASLSLQSCELIGCEDEHQSEKNGADEDVCKWTGSVVDVCEGLLEMKDTSITNSSKGGLSISGGSAVIESCLFENNSKRIERYRSARRNVFCTGSGTLNVVDLKGGDGWERNTSLWILNEGCKLLGIAAERSSEFFIPTLKSVETTQKEDTVELTFRGTLLLPCNLGFQIVSKINNVSSIETHAFAEDEFVSEEEVQGKIGSSLVSPAPTEAEVAVCILFGNVSNPSSTESFVLKNKSESEPKGDEKIVEGGKKEKSIWPIIVIVLVVILLIVLIIAVAFIVRWRKVKNEAKDLREIVNDTVRKDPKLIEMVTMEMSPEEQWRRAEREAEKKNEERIKKRVYEKSLGHSESSEHLLSESGSTEYILGRDSDKIPQWMLEKVDEKEEEEEETRKRTPSPSISSTSTTDTSDTESTFVRGEDLCPTTSSMSNLVDAMACSSPHEKLIVDLRDSMFMLLHGRNKTKEMAIGTLQEREQTAAQILFWVANLALHSFDEMNNPLQSLANLSPHIVLFSEHMVICIALHSDCSSDDSDSSSISSTTTIATSSSDCSCANGNGRGSPPPSSAFEDEDDFRKECMRWKAPELLSGAKGHATKKTVVFSIGMMVWECLTLQIPFGEYEAEAAGQKIANGERPTLCSCEGISLGQTACAAMSQQPHSRPTLQELKKAFIALFPPASAMLTASDAIDLVDATGIPPPSALPASAVSETLTSF